MPNWKKVIISGSNAHVNNITASGHVSALDDSFTINNHTSTELLVEGNITASNLLITNTASITYFETTYESSSIIYSSGSTKFGDTMDDLHWFTGSILTTGSVIVTNNVSASGNLFASLSLDATTAFNTVMYDSTTGQFFHTGSYGGGGGSTFTAAGISGSWQGQNFVSASQTFLDSGQRSGDSGITGSLELSGTGHLTTSGDISASGNLSALVANDNDTAFKTVMYDTATGKFFRTGSYGGGGGGQQDLQDVTDNGEVTTNGGVFWSGQNYRWGGWSSQSSLSGFQTQSSPTPIAYTRVTPQRVGANRWHLVGNMADVLEPGKLAARNWLVFDPELFVVNSGIYNGNGAIGEDGVPGGIGGMVIENGGLQIRVDSASSEPAALSIVPGNDGPGFYFFERGGLTPEGSGSINHNSASARLVFDTGSQAVKFHVGSTDEELKEVLFISRSGVNPRIGIGTNQPLRAFDFKEIRDDNRGGEILIRGSRTIKGADAGDEVGRINFAIDSSSYSKVDTSGSAAEIVALVDEVDQTGIKGHLSLRTANSKTGEPTEILKLSQSTSVLNSPLDLNGTLSVDGSDINASTINRYNNTSTRIELQQNHLEFYGNAYGMKISNTGIIANPSGLSNMDFKVQSDNDAQAIFVDSDLDSIILGSNANTHITSSGNISASGDLTVNNINGNINGGSF